MARIRSIKPDFFTSETIARLPISARLTFIGLWTHVDDNGVCLANEMLIAAALYPLDGPEGVERTREDLRRISGESLVVLYERGGKRYLFVTSWDEHQKVSHPGKKRYPRPDEDGCKSLTWDNADPPESLARSSGESPESLRPEQGAGLKGAGSREQGVPPTAALAVAPRADSANVILGEYIERCHRRPPNSVIGQLGKHVRQMLDEGIDGNDIRRGMAAWSAKGLHPSTLPSVVNEVMNARPANGTPATTKAQSWLALAAEPSPQLRALPGHTA